MKVVIAGANGFIGKHLLADLQQRGHDVTGITRHRANDAIYWNPAKKEIDLAKLAAAHAEVVINLAGESVADRWNAHKKEAIYQSRIPVTNFLAQTLAGLQPKPSVFICASAIGYYGDRGSEVLTENSKAGSTFLSKVCIDWEKATKPAADAAIRTANLRFGIVLSTTGGALPRLVMPFQIGAGGRLGTGKQYMSWISIDDVLAAIRFVMVTPTASGAINVVAPQPITNNEFTETLGKVLHRPTAMPVPTIMAHLAFGSEMADQVLLASDRVLPERLAAFGFQFQFPTLPLALSHILKDRV